MKKETIRYPDGLFFDVFFSGSVLSQFVIQRDVVLPIRAHPHIAAADERKLGRQVPEVDVHQDRYAIVLKDAEHRIVRIESAELLPVAERPPDQEALHITEPAGFPHLPQRAADLENVKITGFEEPDDAVFSVALRKVGGLVETGPGEIDQAVRAAADQPAFERRPVPVKALYDRLLRQVVGESRSAGSSGFMPNSDAQGP